MKIKKAAFDYDKIVHARNRGVAIPRGKHAFGSLEHARKLVGEHAAVAARIGDVAAELEGASGLLVETLGDHTSTTEAVAETTSRIGSLENEKVLLTYKAAAYGRAITAALEMARDAAGAEFSAAVDDLARRIEAALDGVGGQTTLSDLTQRYRAICEVWAALDDLARSWTSVYPHGPRPSIAPLRDLKGRAALLEVVGEAVGEFLGGRGVRGPALPTPRVAVPEPEPEPRPLSAAQVLKHNRRVEKLGRRAASADAATAYDGGI